MRQRATAQTSIANRGRASLSAQVAALFASLGSTPKLWLDPSDPATRFQDQAGTTPVTADGQPYGRANDKSGGGNHVGQVTTTSRPLWRTDGVLSWAQADGIDDSWQSLANLDLSSTDRATVIVGARKVSDAARGVLFANGVNGAAGTIMLDAPSAALNNFLLRTGANVATAPAAAPVTAVVTTQHNLAGTNAIRLNGVQIATAASGAGGSLLNASFNVMQMTPGTGAFFNGNLYGLMIIGRLLTADELSLCERYMAQKSGVIL